MVAGVEEISITGQSRTAVVSSASPPRCVLDPQHPTRISFLCSYTLRRSLTPTLCCRRSVVHLQFFFFTTKADFERRVGGVPNLRRGSRSSLDRGRDQERLRRVRHCGRPSALGPGCRPHDVRRRVPAPQPRRDGGLLFPLSAGTNECFMCIA